MSEELNRQLDELKRAIEEVQAGEGDTDQLADLVHAVDRKLEAPDDAEPHEHLVDRLREAVTEFEADHPRLTQVIARVSDTLSASGI